jgi:cytochrome c-type biogenesis protein CcmH/NrfG
MPWYGWLTIGALTATIAGLVLYLLASRRKQILDIFAEYAEVERKKCEAKIAVLQVRDQKLRELLVEQEAKLEKLEDWYIGQKRTIEQESQDAFESYFNDASAVGKQLDKLLGIGG